MRILKTKRGFTLIELMIVVAIIGILAAIAIPKFANLVAKSKESATKGALGAIRSALSIYYGDCEGSYPIDTLASLTSGNKYLGSIPAASTPTNGTFNVGHPDSPTVTALNMVTTAVSDAGGWAYDNVGNAGGAGSILWGTLVVACTHKDSKGLVWTQY